MFWFQVKWIQGKMTEQGNSNTIANEEIIGY